jgi:very-short-patch-repair endonuclease
MRLKGTEGAKARARSFRRIPSLPETLLWHQLRRSALGVRFRRQHPAGAYILDFFCAPANLAIEIDGATHDFGERALHDQRRDKWLAQRGVTMIRVSATEVLQNPDGVLRYIRDALTRGPPPPPFGGPPPPIASGEE